LLFTIDASHSVFVEPYISQRRVKELATSFTYDFEPLDFWLVVINFWRQDDGLRIVLQKVMWEGGSEKCSINVDLSKLRDVNFFTSWAVNFEPRHLNAVTQTNWENFLAITQCSRAVTIKAMQKLMVNLSQSKR
jgi:hypothetical protein